MSPSIIPQRRTKKAAVLRSNSDELFHPLRFREGVFKFSRGLTRVIIVGSEKDTSVLRENGSSHYFSIARRSLRRTREGMRGRVRGNTDLRNDRRRNLSVDEVV